MTEFREFNSISDMVRSTTDDPTLADEFDALAASRQVVRSLMAMRAVRGFSQADLAAKLNCSQSRISKLEASSDSDWSLGDLAAYAEAVGCDVNLAFVDSTQPIVERIKGHALQIGGLLEQLVQLSHSDDSIARGVSGFFGEAFFNLLGILKRAGDAMPKKKDGSPLVRIEVISPTLRQDTENRLTEAPAKRPGRKPEET